MPCTAPALQPNTIYVYVCVQTNTHTTSAPAALASICATSAFGGKTRKTGTWPLASAQMGGTEASTNQSYAIWQLRGVAKGAGRAISLRIFEAREDFGARSGGGRGRGEEEGPDPLPDLGSVGVTRGCQDSNWRCSNSWWDRSGTRDLGFVSREPRSYACAHGSCSSPGPPTSVISWRHLPLF